MMRFLFLIEKLTKKGYNVNWRNIVTGLQRNEYILEEIMSFSDLKLFALSSNQELAERVAQEIGMELGKSTVRGGKRQNQISSKLPIFVPLPVFQSLSQS